jgi:hypothetical protein
MPLIFFKRLPMILNIQIVIYITNAVGYILQRKVFRWKHDRAVGVF